MHGWTPRARTKKRTDPPKGSLSRELSAACRLTEGVFPTFQLPQRSFGAVFILYEILFAFLHEYSFACRIEHTFPLLEVL